MHSVMDWRSLRNPTEKRHAYYASREWGLKKTQVHQRAGGKCERCKIAPIDAVHHLTYIRLYEEKLEDLMGICTPCHEFVHGRGERDPEIAGRIDQWDRQLLIENGLAIFNTSGQSLVALACPVCGFVFNHLEWVRTFKGNDNYEASAMYAASVRGDVTALAFDCENGHQWRMVFAFHKGSIKIYTCGPDKKELTI